MFSVLLAVSVVAAAPQAPGRFTLALPGLNGVNLAAGEADLQAELIAQKFIAHGVDVKTARDLQTVLGLERQRQLLGCGEDNACLVEMTAALGVDGLLVVDLGKMNDGYVLNLKVLGTNSGKVLALQNSRGTASQLDALLENAVRAILRGLAQSTNRPALAVGAESVATPTAPSLRTWALAPAIVGVVALGCGAAMQVVAGNQFTELSTHPYPPTDAAARRDAGRTLEAGANVALIGGGVALVGATILFFAGASSPVVPLVAVGPQGGALGISGVLP